MFERALQTLAEQQQQQSEGAASEAALELWKRYLDYEFLYGDRATVQSLTARFKEAYPQLPIANDLSLTIRQHSYGDLTPIEDRVWSLLQANVVDHGQVADPAMPMIVQGMPSEPVMSMPTPHVFPFPLLGDEVVSWLLQLPRGWQGPSLHIPSLLRALLACNRQSPTVAPETAPPTSTTTTRTTAKTGTGPSRRGKRTGGDLFEPVPVGRRARGNDESDLLGERFTGRLK